MRTRICPICSGEGYVDGSGEVSCWRCDGRCWIEVYEPNSRWAWFLAVSVVALVLIGVYLVSK